jgi:hypothetical protein
MGGKKLIRRADGSYSPRGLWDNIRANRGSGKKPTKQMLEQESKIKNSQKMGGKRKLMQKGGSGKNSEFGMLSVKAGIDNNPNPTQADRIAGATSKKKKGGMKYKPGGKRKKKMMGGKQPKAMYEKGGFLSEPSVFDLDND